MIVVSNTSPIMNLRAIGKLDLLARLFPEVLIPHAVLQELESTGAAVAEGASSFLPPWVQVRTIESPLLKRSLLLELHDGEAEAIVLATELGADLVLVDERRARQVARRLGLRVIGLVGLLVLAKRTGHLAEVKPLLDELVETAGFWLSTDVYSRALTAAGE